MNDNIKDHLSLQENARHNEEHDSHEEVIRVADEVMDAVQAEIERGRERLKNALARYEERMNGRA